MRSKHRGLAGPWGLGLLLLAGALAPGTGTERPRVVFLTHGAPEPAGRDAAGAFRRALAELGWTDGRTVTVDAVWSGGDLTTLRRLADEIVRARPSVIVGVAPPAVTTLRRLTSSIPIVMVAEPTPVENGLVASLARPGGNVTGLAFDPTTELFAKYVELLKEAVPQATRVGVLTEPDVPGGQLYVRVLNQTAAALKVSLEYHEVRGPADLDAAFTSIHGNRPHALIAAPGAVAWQHRERVARFAVGERLPLMSAFVESADAGALLAYGASMHEAVRRSAAYVDKILRGQRAADLPVEQPSKFELAINARTARALGVAVPRALMVRADRVIE